MKFILVLTIILTFITSCSMQRTVYSAHDLDSKKHQTIKKNSRKKNTLIGLGIGSGVGFAIGMIPVSQFGFKDCSASTGDPGDCRTFQRASWILLPISTLVFGGLGAGIGALLKAKD